MAEKKTISIPSFVKEAGIDISNTENTITTKAAAWASVVNFIKEKDSLSNAKQIVYEDHFKEAAEDWDLNYDQIKQELQDLEPGVSDEDFAIKQANLYPLLTKEGTYKAAKNFYRDRSKLPFDWRREGGGRILKKALKEGIDIPHLEYFLSLAGLSSCNHTKLASGIAQRGLIADKYLRGLEADSIVKQYTDLTEALVKGAEEELEEDPEVILELLAAIDEAGGMNELYGEDVDEIPFPEELVFNEGNPIEELEGAEDLVILDDGSEVLLSEVTDEDLSKCASAIGGEFREQFDSSIFMDDSEKREILNRLDKNECKIFKHIIR